MIALRRQLPFNYLHNSNTNGGSSSSLHKEHDSAKVSAYNLLPDTRYSAYPPEFGSFSAGPIENSIRKLIGGDEGGFLTNEPQFKSAQTLPRNTTLLLNGSSTSELESKLSSESQKNLI